MCLEAIQSEGEKKKTIMFSHLIFLLLLFVSLRRSTHENLTKKKKEK